MVSQKQCVGRGRVASQMPGGGKCICSQSESMCWQEPVWPAGRKVSAGDCLASQKQCASRCLCGQPDAQGFGRSVCCRPDAGWWQGLSGHADANHRQVLVSLPGGMPSHVPGWPDRNNVLEGACMAKLNPSITWEESGWAVSSKVTAGACVASQMKNVGTSVCGQPDAQCWQQLAGGIHILDKPLACTTTRISLTPCSVLLGSAMGCRSPLHWCIGLHWV